MRELGECVDADQRRERQDCPAHVDVDEKSCALARHESENAKTRVDRQREGAGLVVDERQRWVDANAERESVHTRVGTVVKRSFGGGRWRRGLTIGDRRWLDGSKFRR